MARPQFSLRKHHSRPSVHALERRTLLAHAGSIEPSFADRGAFLQPVQPAGDFLPAERPLNLSALQADGKIVLGSSYVAGDGRQSFFLIERLGADGTPDASFGNGGRVAIVGPGRATALVVQLDGSIIEAGSLGQGNFGAIRVLSNGTLDTSYGTQGFAILPKTIGTTQDIQTLDSATLTADGQLVVVGSVGDPTSPSISVEPFAARFAVGGTLDPSFGTSGVATVPITINGLTNTTPTAVKVQPSGVVGQFEIINFPGGHWHTI